MLEWSSSKAGVLQVPLHRGSAGSVVVVCVALHITPLSAFATYPAAFCCSMLVPETTNPNLDQSGGCPYLPYELMNS